MRRSWHLARGGDSAHARAIRLGTGGWDNECQFDLPVRLSSTRSSSPSPSPKASPTAARRDSSSIDDDTPVVVFFYGGGWEWGKPRISCYSQRNQRLKVKGGVTGFNARALVATQLRLSTRSEHDATSKLEERINQGTAHWLCQGGHSNGSDDLAARWGRGHGFVDVGCSGRDCMGAARRHAVITWEHLPTLRRASRDRAIRRMQRHRHGGAVRF